MSFLTVAAAVTFSALVTYRIRIVDYEVVVHLIFLAAGTIIVLEATSPRLYSRDVRSSVQLLSPLHGR
jgi:hypothetical protein